MSYWLGATAAKQGRGIEAGRLDPRDLAEDYLERIQRHPDMALIYARLTPARAREEAAAAAERARSGTRRHPLDGVPLSWKDNVDTAGIATEGGSRLLAGRMPVADAPVLASATAAGLVCLGKTHLSELAFSGLGLNPMTATPPNTKDRRRVPGGSSSGAAASVALLLAPAGIGSDTGGSVRVPAAWNNLVGLKTTIGRIPTDGVVPLATSLDTIGPLTRTVEDAALVYSALAGLPPKLPEATRPERLWLPTTLAKDDLDPEIAAAFDAALSRLGAAGVQIDRAPCPALAEAEQVMVDHGGLFNEGWKRWGAEIEANPDTLFGPIETRFRGNAKFTDADHATSKARLDALGAATARDIETNGLIVMPSTPILPPFLSRLLADETYYAERNLPSLRNTRLGNLLGLCAITLPLPEPMCGLMLFAPPNGEDRLIAAGRALEPILAG